MWSRPTRNRAAEARATIAVVTALEHIGSGKVREIFRVDDDRFLIVATDRISAFDVVLGEDIPHKGVVLTGVSIHWFDMLDTPHHLITSNTAAMNFLSADQKRSYAGRSMLSTPHRSSRWSA